MKTIQTNGQGLLTLPGIMRRTPVLVTVAIMLSVAAAWAVKITLFSDLDLYLDRGKQIVIADFVAAHDTHQYRDGLYSAEVDVVKVLAGPTKPGKLRVLTLYPMTRGTRYLLYSLAEPDFQAIPQLSVVALPDGFDLGRLEGKTLREQVRLIFATRRVHVERELEQRREELGLLDKALGKTQKFGANADSTLTNLPTEISSRSTTKPVPNVVVGRVTDQAGTPIGQVRWRISAVEKWQDGQWKLPPLTYLPRSDQPEFVTDSEGRFELKYPEKARYDLQFDKDGYAPVFLYQVGSDARELHVVMKEGVPVRGSIVRADGTPLTGKTPFVVKLQFPSRDVWFATSTHVDAQGRFEFPHVSPPAKAPFWKEPAQWQIVCLGKVVRIDVAEGKPAEVRIEISQADIERDYRERGGRITTGP